MAMLHLLTAYHDRDTNGIGMLSCTMVHRLALVAFLGSGLLATGPAGAATVLGPDGQAVIGPDGTPLQQTKFEAACGAAVQRFCPALAAAPGQTRNEVICLRPYRSSLSFTCRRAVDSARK